MAFENLTELLNDEEMAFLTVLTQEFPDLASVIEKHTDVLLKELAGEKTENIRCEAIITIAAFLLICMGSNETPQFKNGPAKQKILDQLGYAFLGADKIKLNPSDDATSPLTIIIDTTYDAATNPETVYLISQAVELYFEYVKMQLEQLATHRDPLQSSGRFSDRAND